MKNPHETIDRYPAVAGQFYPAKADKLNEMLNKLFAQATPKKQEYVRAIISPHAGYVFSGGVAASAFNQTEASYKRVVLLASSHQAHFEGASVFCDGDYIMPYGKELVDREIGKKLVSDHPALFTDNPIPHKNEHSLEVQLPFLHHVLKTGYMIVPIILGSVDPITCFNIAEALKPLFNADNLFVISSDFSHYPTDADARKVDGATKNAILSNNPDKLLQTLKANTMAGIPHLSTSLCGWTSVLTLMYLTAGNSACNYFAIDYHNSGDAPLYGEKDRVVGYWAIAVLEQETSQNDFALSETDKSTLLKLARECLQAGVHGEKPSKPDLSGFSDILKTNCGAFVTLHIKGHLRGCIGCMTGEMPLYKMVQEMAVSSAMHDYRFEPVRSSELDLIDIEISVLSPLQKIEDASEIVLGKHGILIEKGRNHGVFLPQVATETGWTLEQYLGHCAQDKAEIGWDGWKTAAIYTFTATVFGEK